MHGLSIVRSVLPAGVLEVFSSCSQDTRRVLLFSSTAFLRRGQAGYNKGKRSSGTSLCVMIGIATSSARGSAFPFCCDRLFRRQKFLVMFKKEGEGLRSNSDASCCYGDTVFLRRKTRTSCRQRCTRLRQRTRPGSRAEASTARVCTRTRLRADLWQGSEFLPVNCRPVLSCSRVGQAKVLFSFVWANGYTAWETAALLDLQWIYLWQKGTHSPLAGDL